MPSDVIGYTVVDINTGKGSYKPGAAMCNFLLADEINRASPKVQSSLLEAMEELQISVDGETHQLPKPFMTLATQNPIETFGTYHLPEAQLDRFLMRISVGYPDRAAEMKMLDVMPQRQETQPVMPLEELMELRRQAAQVKVADNVKAYILSLVTATRFLQQVKLGASPRGLHRDVPCGSGDGFDERQGLRDPGRRKGSRDSGAGSPYRAGFRADGLRRAAGHRC